jgi:hypothetical protein
MASNRYQTQHLASRGSKATGKLVGQTDLVTNVAMAHLMAQGP